MLTRRGADDDEARGGPEEFLVHSTHRFDRMGNPADETIVMAVQHVAGDTTGIIHAAFGPDASAGRAAVLRRLPSA